jgi:Protein of unknown function (DUF1552)
MRLGKTLAPLEPLKKKINVINGLLNQMSVGIGIHPGQTGSLLSGVTIQKGPILRAGITMDQVLAQNLGQETPQSSIVLACEQPMTGYHETNFSMAYSSHISWQSADSPVPNEVYPSLAFDSLFENRGSLRYLSILDRVKDRAESLSRKVSSTDKSKLDEYLTSVREVERRIERMRALKDQAEDQAKLKDRHCLLYLSNMWAGWKHDNMKMPVVTAGGLGGTLETGRSLDYLHAGDENRKLCSLYLSIMDRMGVKLDSFGDASTRLQGL